MQPKVVFLENLIAHKEFSIVSEVFLCLSYFSFMCDYLTFFRGYVSTMVYIFVEGFCRFVSFFIGGKCLEGLLSYTRLIMGLAIYWQVRSETQ